MGWSIVKPTPLGLTLWDEGGVHEGGVHLEKYLALHRSFVGCHQCRSSPANILAYGSGLDRTFFGSLCQIFEIGPEYSSYLGDLTLYRPELFPVPRTLT